MMVSMVLPLVQLIVLGYAFGGKVTGVEIGFVDQDHSVESHKIREMFNGITAGPRTFKVIEYESEPEATHDLQTGKVRALVVVPHDFRGASINMTGRASRSPKTIPTNLYPAQSSSACSKWWRS